MARINGASAEHNSALKEDESKRVKLSVLLTAEAVQSLPPESLAPLQALMQNGPALGFWLTPKALMPGVSGESRYTIDLRQRVVHFLNIAAANVEASPTIAQDTRAQRYAAALRRPPEALVSKAVLNMTRYLVLCRRGPSKKAHGTLSLTGGGLSASTVSGMAYSELPLLYALAIAKAIDLTIPRLGSDTGVLMAAISTLPPEMFSMDDGLLHLIAQADLAALTRAQQSACAREWSRMECMANEGLWSDVPGAWSAPDVSSPATSAVGTAVSAPTKSGGTHLPLPDAYVAQMATRSIWLQENIAPGLFEVLRNIPRIFIENTNISLKPESRVSQRRDAFEEYLRNFDWRDAKGKPLKSIPFELRLSGRGGPNAIEALQAEDLAGDDEDGEASDIGENTRWAQTWPPRRFTDIIVLAATLQRCNIFICGLCFGSRVSELGTLNRPGFSRHL